MAELMTIEEVAAFLSLSTKTIYRLLQRHDIPAAKIGGQWRFDKEIINSWIRQLSEASGKTKPKANILVIDDEEVIIELFKQALIGTGYRVISASNALDGLNLMRKFSIDLVFLDLRMPGMNGVELFRQIKNTKPNLPVIIITGYPNSDMMSQALVQGPFALMNKPFTDKDVLEAIHSFLKTDIRIDLTPKTSPFLG
jgi:excisionase family DNA binding protein